MNRRPTNRRTVRSERGAAMAVTMILLTALLAGGALAMYMQIADTKSAQYVTESRGSLFCAEAGLSAGRPFVSTHATEWNVMLDGDESNNPVGYPIEGDLDGDGVNDFRVVITDNDDELSSGDPADNDKEIDTDYTIFMVSTCLKYPDTPRQVLEMISFSGGGKNYLDVANQGGLGTNNATR